MPMRPTSTKRLVGEQQAVPLRYSPAADISSLRVVELRLAVEAEALHVLAHRRLAELLGDLREDGVDRLRQRRRQVDRCPKDSLKSFCSGTPEIFTPLSPLTVDCGVNCPVSIAAVSVTTLNVEPGA